MDKKEEIMLAAIELAAEKGLGSVSLEQIAAKAGIKKPSLYNHFKSKSALIAALYEYLRENSKKVLPQAEIDISLIANAKSAYQVLYSAVSSYVKMCTQKDMFTFYKFLYSQRAVDPAAAAIMCEETNKMINATKALFYALCAHKLLTADDIDTAAVSFAMTIHAMTEHQYDKMLCGEDFSDEQIRSYIRWFCSALGGAENE